MKAYFLKNSLVTLVLFSLLVVPLSVMAAAPSATDSVHTTKDTYKGLVRCSGVAQAGETQCDFNALIGTFTYLINWGFGISLPIAVALFVWAGLLYVTGIPNKIDRAKAIFKTAAGGFAIMLLAFTIVHTIVGWIGNSSSTATNNNPNPLPVTTTESLLKVNK